MTVSLRVGHRGDRPTEERVKILTLRMALRAERGPCPQQEDSPKSGNDGDGSQKESWQEKQVQSEEQFKASGDVFYFKKCSTLRCVQKAVRRPWNPPPVLLPGKSHGRKSLVGCSPWGR